MVGYNILEPPTFHRILQKIAAVLCVAIPHQATVTNRKELSIWYVAYVAFFLVVTGVMYCLSVTSMMAFVNFKAGMSELLFVIVTEALFFTNAISVLNATFFRRKTMLEIIRNLKLVHLVFQEKLKGFEDTKTRDVFIYISVSLITLSILVQTFITLKDPSLYSTTYFTRVYVNLYILSFIPHQIYYLVNCLKHEFHVLNIKMRYVVNELIRRRSGSSVEALTFFMEAFDKLADTIELVNKSFGLQIALLTWLSIFKVIINFTFCIKYASGYSEYKEYNLKHYVFPLWEIAIYVMLSMLVATACGQATEKAKEAFVVGYKLLIEMPSCPKDPYEQKLREYLLLLAEHLGHRNVNFSAMGFFNVDNTLLFTIFGSIASYIVITLQFD